MAKREITGVQCTLKIEFNTEDQSMSTKLQANLPASQGVPAGEPVTHASSQSSDTEERLVKDFLRSVRTPSLQQSLSVIDHALVGIRALEQKFATLAKG